MLCPVVLVCFVVFAQPYRIHVLSSVSRGIRINLHITKHFMMILQLSTFENFFFYYFNYIFFIFVFFRIGSHKHLKLQKIFAMITCLYDLNSHDYVIMTIKSYKSRSVMCGPLANFISLLVCSVHFVQVQTYKQCT